MIANETVLGEPLLERIRERVGRWPASFLIISPQSDPSGPASRGRPRLRRALAMLRGEGIEAHGQVAHPDPFTAAMEAVRDERVDEIIVSTFPGSGRRGSVATSSSACFERRKVPVEHVVVEPSGVGEEVHA